MSNKLIEVVLVGGEADGRRVTLERGVHVVKCLRLHPPQDLTLRGADLPAEDVCIDVDVYRVLEGYGGRLVGVWDGLSDEKKATCLGVTNV